MDWQLAITINVMALSAFAIAFSVMRWRAADATWLLVHGVILAIGAAGLSFGFAYTGMLLAAIFLPFVLVPGMLLLRANRATALADYASASRYARVAATLHPSPKMRFHAAMIRAFAGASAGATAAALHELQAAAPVSYRPLLDASLARIEARWADVLTIVRDAGPRQSELIEFEVRALGELGRRNEMVRLYHGAKSVLYGDALRNCQLFVLAFCGKAVAAGLITGSKRQPMHAQTAAYWHAVALISSGAMREEGRHVLGELAASAEQENVRRAAQTALCASMRPLEPLSAEAAREADAVALRWQETAPLRQARLLASPLTLALLAANAIMFALEHWLGGPEDLAALYKLGALWPASLFDLQEWWRLPAAMFLHFGWAHMIFNMASLALLGRMIEAAYGAVRMAAIYVLGGLGSMATVVALMQAGIIPASFLVGASGAIMALIGAWGARELGQYLRTRDVLDRRSAVVLLVVMAGQFAIDLSVPQVSLAAHATGFAIGLALGFALRRRAGAGSQNS